MIPARVPANAKPEDEPETPRCTVTYDLNDPDTRHVIADDGDDPEPDWDEDGHQQYKDDLAQGRINEDGTYREPDEPDWETIEYAKHCEAAHSGAACDCPPPTPEETAAMWAEQDREHRAGAHDGGECDCVAPF